MCNLVSDRKILNWYVREIEKKVTCDISKNIYDYVK